MNGGPSRASAQRVERGTGYELVSPTGGNHCAKAGGEAGMRELDGGCGPRGQYRVVAENHHGRRDRSAKICEWWQRRHA
jgi:hypothetical protein